MVLRQAHLGTNFTFRLYYLWGIERITFTLFLYEKVLIVNTV